MNAIEWLAAAGVALAAVPAGLFVRNLGLYAPPPLLRSQSPSPSPSSAGGEFPARPRCSVLIPARNEAKAIADAIGSVLNNREVDLEVIVLDDGSTDRTADIVRQIAGQDGRVQLATAPPLPAGWCGKQHACSVLAGLARHPLLVFLDADVRLSPDALGRMAAFLEKSGVALASGVPRQETRTVSEQLLIPLIHFVLLGFLPMSRMRRSRAPSYGAGCGQLFIARSDAYHASGGHGAIRGTLHDGPKLPRAFRAAGFATELFDATDVASCRMYSTDAEVWRGLAKNAHEALGSPALIGPATVFLFGGQVLPFCLLLAAIFVAVTPLSIALAVVGALLAWLPRLLGARRFRQSHWSALFHPLGISGLLAIQWHAFLRQLTGRPSTWKGRSYEKTGGERVVSYARFQVPAGK